jgi:hypothetical protein
MSPMQCTPKQFLVVVPEKSILRGRRARRWHHAE